MSNLPNTLMRAEPEPLPENIRSTQPGGGTCYRIELAWGKLRRSLLKRFRPAYVRKMADLRRGSLPANLPHEILDSRDLKFLKNRTDCHWLPDDDPFYWRENIPFARWGLAELQLMSYPLLALTIGLAIAPFWWTRVLALAAGVVCFLIAYFFRDPRRKVPQGEGLVVVPADGKVVDISRLDHHEFIGGPAVRVGIFLTIFNVHINRSPVRARVVSLKYTPGQFLNAIKAESLLYNENMWIGLEEEAYPHRRFVVRQVSGAIARRIVCDLRPGQIVDIGEKFGMIKLGSRTELILPDEEGLEIEVQVGQWISAGKQLIARYRAADGSN